MTMWLRVAFMAFAVVAWSADALSGQPAKTPPQRSVDGLEAVIVSDDNLMNIDGSTRDGKWWVLVRFYDQGQSGVPRAIGPFPTKGMCRTAAHDLDPTDSRFWTSKQRADAARQTKEIDAAFAAAPLKAGWRCIEGRGCRAADGSGVMGFGTASYGPPPPSAITDCVTVFDPAVLR